MNLEFAEDWLNVAASASVDTMHFECLHFTHRWEVWINLLTFNKTSRCTARWPLRHAHLPG